ncbi:MAG: alpha-L-rhamnosidase N-terminal domain-containing protein, partial [Cyclobacteriaceae bacterium]|nr:alpha-L-rhamnosidase N-terminal domain-containing protein [Cyclobacteriaceae bacterium]
MSIKKYLIFSSLFLWVGISSCQKSTDSIRVVNPRCENRIDPLGIDALNPHLSWNSESTFRNKKQSAYQIIVSDSQESLTDDKGNLWDTKKVNSERSIQIQYQGKELSSELICYWKVRVWDERGQVSDWSSPGKWEMGLLNQSDWEADWICDGKVGPQSIKEYYEADPAPLFRRDFKVQKEIKKARLYISGLGYYEATINGEKVGDHVLDPGWTNYDKRVLYTTYNVTDQIKEGGNSIGVTLGNGWFNPLPMALFGKYNLRENLSIGRPKFIAHLKIYYTDGSTQTIESNEEWLTHEGPIIRNNIYLGEIYDARKEISGWDTFGFDAD